ncbi:hypothetical protein F4813DRAFT_282235 [Daldinia decipiens]|uniref:uncharacterized protein n=1 Tax=Daldinia decipiens TaxID=326647 RepID=UPI0020C287D8|nr:uncharacterized protein F4813DRAFT_282235 [Daldinia decipiens]KAI1653139.1 hypothetical protein F4813DRAFT_282235 [Daldinia decipiens]
MPISPETRRITDREWEDHKLRICELYIDLGRKLEGNDGVIETMAKEGFTATVPQYEHRFRKWRVRKNIKRAEWERIINETRQGGEITHIDRTISRPQLQRARRRYIPRVHRGKESVSRNYDDTTRVEVGHMSELESQRSILSAEIDVNTTTTMAVGAEINGVVSSQNMQDFTLSNEYSNTINYDADMIDSLNFNDPFLESVAFDPFQINMRDRHYWLPPLPSTQLVAMFIKGVYNKWLTIPRPGALTKTSDSNFLWKFMNAVTKPVLTSRSLTSPPALANFSSLEVFAGEEWSQFDRLPDDVALEARFDGRLIASIINGFVGLESIPAEGVLKFLNRHYAMQLMVIEFLNAQLSPVAKSFAEKLFPVYLRTDNTEAIKYLLSTRLVVIDEAVCHYRGERHTPLEIAAIYQSFEVLRFLISEGADFNKSFPRYYHSNALHLLIQNLNGRRSTLDDKFLNLVDAFLEAGATISIDTIREALQSVDLRLSIHLIENVASQAPQKLVSHKDLLGDIVKSFGKEYATSIIELIINNCQELGKAGYLSKFHLHVADALNEAAKRAYDKLVAILLPYASIPGRNKLSITVEEAGNPNPSPDKDLGLDRNTEDSEIFISALRSGDQNCLRSLEERGVLNSLQGYRIGQALTAALKAGNLGYATKTLDLDPDFEFVEVRDYSPDDSRLFDVADAMDAALAHDFNDIAEKLLAVGVTTRPLCFQVSHPAPLLYVAVVRKRPDFVRNIIESGCDPDIFDGLQKKEWPILEAAIEYNEDSVIDDIWRACKACCGPIDPTYRTLKLALEKGRVDLFLDIAKYSPQGHNIGKDRALRVAVECENESVLDELISLGAKADNDTVLKEAIDNHSSMVTPLLDRFWKAYPQGRAGYGSGIVWEALHNYSKSPKFFDQVFAWDLVRLNVNYQAIPGNRTLLYGAIGTENSGIVKRFIDAGSDVNSVIHDYLYSNSGYVRATPLLTAIEIGIAEMVQLLIDNGADVNRPAMSGLRWTPLQKAAEMNNLPIVRLLLKNGARVNDKPSMFDGGTALQFAAIQGNSEMATTLIEHGAEYNIPPPFGCRGRWPLEGAAENGRLDMIELLWNGPWDPFDDKQCQNAMRLAERNGHFGCKEKIKELMGRSSYCNNISFPAISWPT